MSIDGKTSQYIYKPNQGDTLSEPIGAKINLRELFELKTLRAMRGQRKRDPKTWKVIAPVLHFQDENGDATWIKITHMGLWRFEGEIIEPPMTQEDLRAMNKRAAKEAKLARRRELYAAKKHAQAVEDMGFDKED